MKFKKILMPLKTEFREFTKEIVGFDIETYGKKNTFILATLKGETFEKTFYNIPDLIKFLNGNNRLRKCVIVATNIGFDFLGCFYTHKEYWNVVERDGHIYSFSWFQSKSDKKPIKFYDTLNFFPASVDELGEILNIPKMEHPPNFELQEDGSYKVRKPKNSIEYEQLKKYCMNDSLISQQFFRQLVIPYINSKQCRLKSTIASTSLEIFKRNFLKESYTISPYSIQEKSFKAYYGGRTECFKRGIFKDVNCYDVNSLYPSVMINELPNPNYVNEVKETTLKLIMKYEGVSYIEGVQDKRYIPLLPVRMDNKLLFPTGIIKGYYTHIEIREALKNGFRITNFGDGNIYTKTCKPFEDFVKTTYAERREKQKTGNKLELMDKRILNSLYGKFAFNYRFNNTFKPADKMKADDYIKNQFVEEINGFVYIRNTGLTEPTNYSIPIWSAYITAYARLKLYSWLKDEQISKNLIYTDTDSLFLSDGKELPQSTELGELKLEYSCDEAIFVRPKFYSAKKVKIKGIKSVKTKDKFHSFLKNPKVYEDRFTKLRTAIRSKETYKTGVLVPNEIIRVFKELDLEDEKRKWSGKFNPNIMEDSTAKHVYSKHYIKT